MSLHCKLHVVAVQYQEYENGLEPSVYYASVFLILLAAILLTVRQLNHCGAYLQLHLGVPMVNSETTVHVQPLYRSSTDSKKLI